MGIGDYRMRPSRGIGFEVVKASVTCQGMSDWGVWQMVVNVKKVLSVSGFGFRIPGLGFPASGTGFWVPSFGFRVPGFKLRISEVGFRASGFGYWHTAPAAPAALEARTSETFSSRGTWWGGFGFQDPGCRFGVPKFGYRMSGRRSPPCGEGCRVWVRHREDGGGDVVLGVNPVGVVYQRPDLVRAADPRNALVADVLEVDRHRRACFGAYASGICILGFKDCELVWALGFSI